MEQIIQEALKEFLDHASLCDVALFVAMLDLLRGRSLGHWASQHPHEFPALARLIAFRDSSVSAESLPRLVRRFVLVWSYARRQLTSEN